VFHVKRDRATNANAHLVHLQALTHKLMLQLAKEPNFCQRANYLQTKVTVKTLVNFFKELVNKNVFLFLRLLVKF